MTPQCHGETLIIIITKSKLLVWKKSPEITLIWIYVNMGWIWKADGNPCLSTVCLDMYIHRMIASVEGLLRETEWLLVSPFEKRSVLALVFLYCTQSARVQCVCLDVCMCVCERMLSSSCRIMGSPPSPSLLLQKSSHLSSLISRKQLTRSKGFILRWHVSFIRTHTDTLTLTQLSKLRRHIPFSLLLFGTSYLQTQQNDFFVIE